MVRTWGRDIGAGLERFLHLQQGKGHPGASSVARNLIQYREINRMISCSIVGLVERSLQVRKVVTGLALKADSLYCR